MYDTGKRWKAVSIAQSKVFVEKKKPPACIAVRGAWWFSRHPLVGGFRTDGC